LGFGLGVRLRGGSRLAFFVFSGDRTDGTNGADWTSRETAAWRRWRRSVVRILGLGRQCAGAEDQRECCSREHAGTKA
jgi:hypothetical protein